MSLEKRIITKKETCEFFEEGFCHMYKFDCFHDDANPLNEETRCNKLVPKTKEELMDWMDWFYCTDCNEPVCNDCDVYINWTYKKVK